jgi:sacsin
VNHLPQKLSDSVNDLPIWPRISSKAGYLTAREAIVAKSSAFVVPWIKDYHRFTNASSLHETATIGDGDMLTQYVLPCLPQSIINDNRASYIRLMKAMIDAKETSQPMMVSQWAMYRLAPRQDGTLCLASDLFDHDVAVFSAAFRTEASKNFLISEAHKHMWFWYKLGIRHFKGGRFEGRDYLACLHALQGRLAGAGDRTLAADTETVLRPLCTHDGSLDGLNQMTWKTVASLPLFLVSSAWEHEPQFRKSRMNSLVSQEIALSLKDIIRREYAPVCWSKTPFVIHEPAVSSFLRVGVTGKPSCAVVLQHLTFLAEIAQSVKASEVERYIDDLRSTYEFLQANTLESKGAFSEPGAAIWFNSEEMVSSAVSIDILRSSWSSLENLILDSPCDSPPLMTVQPFLRPFSSLLKELGCESLYYPPITLPSSDAAKSSLALIRELFQEEILTDVKFAAEGMTISAHKLILASRSEYCKTYFHGPWARKSDSNGTNEAIPIEGMTYEALKVLIEFCYNEGHDWASGARLTGDESLSAIADKLDFLLDVLKAADRWLMADLHADAQRQIFAGIKFFVRPDNIKHVMKLADEASAKELKEYCEESMLKNAAAILLADAD